MAHGYRNLQHWNQWLPHHAWGRHLLAEEERTLSLLLTKHYGKHALLLGVGNQHSLLNSTNIAFHSLISPFVHTETFPGYIEGDFHEIPILTGSIDLVLLPHTLEFIDNPRQLLSEACRIIKPEGLIVICGFNPYSTWGLRKLFTKDKITPWNANFLPSGKIKSWLQLADFEMERHSSIMFAPPFKNPHLYAKFQFLEKIGRNCFPSSGGVYILLARAKVVPLTPIRLKWKQKLNDIRITPSIPGNVAR